MSFNISSMFVIANMNDRPSQTQLEAAMAVIEDPTHGYGGSRFIVPGARVNYVFYKLYNMNFDNWRTWIGAIDTTHTSFLEIGSFEGNSMINIRAIAGNKISHCDAVDLGGFIANPAFGEARQTILMNNLPRTNCQLYLGASSIVLPILTGINLDCGRQYALVFVDGSHHADDVLLDAEYAFRMCAVGGVIVFDDYRYWSDENDDALAESALSPRRGIHTWMLLHGDQLEELPKASNDYGQQIAFKKVAASSAGPVTSLHLAGGTGMNPADFAESAIRFPHIIKPVICDVDVTPVNVITRPETNTLLKAVGLAPFDIAATAIHQLGKVQQPIVDACSQSEEPAVRGFGNFVKSMKGVGDATARALGGVADWGLGRRKYGWHSDVYQK